MRVKAFIAAHQLYPITPLFAREILGVGQEFRPHAPTTLVRSHVDALNLTAPARSVLKMLKDNNLAHRDDGTLRESHHKFTAPPPRFEHGVPVLVESLTILDTWTQGAFINQRHRCGYLMTFNCAYH